MKFEVDVQLEGIPGRCAIEWEWENVENVAFLGLSEPAGPPKVTVKVTAVEPLTLAAASTKEKQ